MSRPHCSDERRAGLVLIAGPMDRALPGENAKRRQELALVHQIEGAPLLGVGDPHDLVQFGAAMLLLERPEQAAALDAGELLVVAGEDQFGAGRPRLPGHSRQMLGRQHRRLIDDQHRAAVPSGRPLSRRLSSAAIVVALRKPSRCRFCTTWLVQPMPMTR